jgi:hypothetical protein
MTDQPEVFYVRADKTWGKATTLPQGAYQITEETFNLLQDNADCLDISIVDGKLHISVSLISYKRKALHLVELTVGNYRVGDDKLADLRDCVIAETSFFDSANGNILDAVEAKSLFAYFVSRQNELRRVAYVYVDLVRNAKSPEDVDAALESLDQTLKGIP